MDRKARARTLRKNLTEEEAILWSRLKAYRTNGVAFRRQVPVGIYVADFLCRKADLIVEIDGNHHGEDDQMQYDETRDRWLEAQGYKVLRYWNSMIRNELDSVLDDIDAHLKERGLL
ncbi:MAG: DUF559 domain-containing protein [Pseudomonadota bacterium]